MLNPTKRLIAPRKQQPQANRPPRPPFWLQARRIVLHGIRTARRRFEHLHARGCLVVQQCVETVLPPDLLAPSVILRLTDRPCCSVSNAMGSLFASRGILPKADKSEEKEKKEEKFFISDVLVVGVEGELKQVAHSVLTVFPNFSYTLTEINNDMRKVLDTGYFKGCWPRPEVTRDGIVLYVDVEPNPEIRGIVSKGASALPPSVFEDAVKNLLGKTFNYNDFSEAMRQVNDWYSKEGVVGEVIDANFDEPNIPVLTISEPIINRIDLRYFDARTGEAKEEGNVKTDVIMRHVSTKVGGAMNTTTAQRDVEAIFATGLFADVKILINRDPDHAYEPGRELETPRINFLIDLYENPRTGGLGIGAGWSAQSLTEGSLPGFVGNVEYIEKNMFGLGQKLISRMEFGQVDKLFKVEYDEPWMLGDKHQTQRTFSVMNTRTSGNPFYASAAGATGVERFKTVIGRLLSTITMQRSVTDRLRATLGLTAQRITLMDNNSRAIRQDFTRSPVNVSGDFHDLMFGPFVKVACTGWANTNFVFTVDKAIPVRRDWLSITKCTARAEKVFRLGPTSLVIYAKGGATVGKVPPYEAFPLGGINSIRGYREGSVGTSCHFVEGTTELRVPLVSNLQGTVFVDAGSDLNTGTGVVGNPGRTMNKPGRGMGIGFGVRVDSPVGPLRLEWAWNDQRSRLFHAGFGDHR